MKQALPWHNRKNLRSKQRRIKAEGVLIVYFSPGIGHGEVIWVEAMEIVVQQPSSGVAADHNDSMVLVAEGVNHNALLDGTAVSVADGANVAIVGRGSITARGAVTTASSAGRATHWARGSAKRC